MGHYLPQFGCAIGFECHPDFERAEPTRQVGSEVGGPWLVARHPTHAALQIGRLAGKGGSVQRGIAHHNAARVVRHLRPFMKIKGHRVRLAQALQQRALRGRKHGQRTVGGVHMKPQAVCARQCGQGRQVVYRAGIHRARAAHHHKGLQAGCRVLRNGGLQGVQVDAVVGVYTDQAQRIATQAGHVHGAGHTVVGFDRGVGHQPAALQSGPPHVGA